MKREGVKSFARVALVVAAIGASVVVLATRSGSDGESQPHSPHSVDVVPDSVAEVPDAVQALPAAISSAGSDWVVTFDDPFDGSELGPEWTTCYWWQVDGGCTIASNDEVEWYRPEGVRVAGGILELAATADPQLTTDGVSLPFRSGMVSTGQPDNDGSAVGFAFTYGYVEAIVRLPDGAGTWPAVWMLSADRTSLPEIDIVEHYGDDSTITSRVHQRVDGERQSQGIEATLVPTTDGWHRVGVLWTEERVEFYLDDILTGVIDDATLVPHTPMYLIVNLAMGGQAGPVDDQALPQQFDIDRIRVWQTKEST